ncbi:restriction endonuclease subunit S [Campylobacter sp. MIT 99-7217]|uniref:restriction endonuclease subunit S n=1 Tax=Campylobacter sp. MIT 99-7217 TaxID=535091 RepID=UPI0021AF94AB|nr:restriction endonuclease subunit S [Campylobacter sp. MIT 99-7217]
MFEVKPTKAYKLTNIDLFEKGGKYPIVTNSSLNNGVSGYTNLKPTEKANMITYSDTTTSEGIFYQPRDFVGYSHVQGLYPLQDINLWNETSLLYFVVAFRKSAFGRFSYADKFNRKIASQMKVILPTQNSQIAFEFIQNFIKAIEKETIKEVVLFSQRELKAYEEAIKKES